jgi:hypothetical protein
MSIQNFLISALLKWRQQADMKLSAEHRFKRNRKFMAAVRSRANGAVYASGEGAARPKRKKASGGASFFRIKLSI